MGRARNPWLDRRVLNYAHRGGAREGPSSTLWAIQRALENGATAIELDVHATADGVVVVCHDPTVDRTTNGQGPIAAMTLAEVQALDNAYWWVPGEEAVTDRNPEEYPLRGHAADNPALRIPTLDEVLTAFPGVLLNLDIKQTAPMVEPYEAAVAAVLLAHGRTDDVIVASFLDEATEAYRGIVPDACISFGVAGARDFWLAIQEGREPPATPHVALQVPPSAAGHELVTAEVVEAAHAAGTAVHVWTIDDPAEMRRLIDLGVDGVMTDCPSVLTGVLEETGVGWDGLS